MGTLTLRNPATGEVMGTLQENSPEEVHKAMERARLAFGHWGSTPVSARVHYLRNLRHYLVEHGEELAKKISEATGKVALEAYMTEIFVTADTIRFYEKNAERMLAPRKVPTPIALSPKKSSIHYQPMGVVAVISPWNYPFQLSVVPVLSALIAGNTVILKPSEITPGVGVLIEELFQAVPAPQHIVQVLHGGRQVGQALVAARPDKIFFTGSVATGKKIMAQAAEHLIPVELELGGKDPMIVLEDAHLERAANGAVWGAFTNSGQVCMSVERVYVHERVYPEFLRLVKEKTAALRHGFPDQAEVGSMTSPQQIGIVRQHVEEALAKGAIAELGGSFSEDGMFLPPTILTGVTHEMKIMREETFGPILPIMTFSTEEEAIRLANDTPYGLNASVWSQNKAKAKRVALQLESGNVCINDVIISFANPNLPFGGVKQSGIGRYRGPEGLQAFTHAVSIIHDPGKKKREINWYPYTEEQQTLFVGLTKTLFGKGQTWNSRNLLAAWREWKRLF
ncbi:MULTISPECIES: aldehyde dehydrogenase family protein [Brevibacillus]|jgi:acyl-CoA reductase-like NAD-dependent aldehyde dehydrogenase|uniref:Aldehyde dehydrogenase n=1 Tax=Brevibacillus borstelensis AK1 TaxID=1300222 RepID=M8E3Z6_9BACL|nr:aldehyde dehydrogenase family protein [Brevibacillus borstelensis]EMT50185.1 aldehyde dehydrogenase [Brevibacillus borstelensis AK1]KKX54501.1 aldehyde dehydrogenase [Brevibacillus borstelensis cifa_chp40]MBE5397404.1 aldehyde dehydrogenase family protein [Brevibacillus borstelensis]MCM3470391.1 aldehyde dehydrogenase family protein [Brevibacillus borstelensis]MCM3557210.1 aldehyde dehydrogenase family protein [Brevibacillus borstelensis]